MNKFEQDLKEFFPDIYKLYELGKSDRYVWEVVDSLLYMNSYNKMGKIEIVVQDGKINYINETVQRTGNRSLGKTLTKTEK